MSMNETMRRLAEQKNRQQLGISVANGNEGHRSESSWSGDRQPSEPNGQKSTSSASSTSMSGEQLRRERFSQLMERMDEMSSELKELIESKVSTPMSLATLPPPEEKLSPEQIAQQVSFETMQQFAPVVSRMAKVIEAMERSHTKAGEMLTEQQMQQAAWETASTTHAAQVKRLSTLITAAGDETQALRMAALQTKEGIFDMVATRWGRILFLNIAFLIFGALLVILAYHQFVSPDWLTIERSNNWLIYTDGMTAEQKAQLLTEMKAKRARLEAEQDTSPTAAAGGGQQTTSGGSNSSGQQSVSSGTPPQSAPAQQPNGRQQSRTRRH